MLALSTTLYGGSPHCAFDCTVVFRTEISSNDAYAPPHPSFPKNRKPCQPHTGIGLSNWTRRIVADWCRTGEDKNFQDARAIDSMHEEHERKHMHAYLFPLSNPRAMGYACHPTRLLLKILVRAILRNP